MGGLGEKPVFDIRKDSIYYFQKDSAYPYYLSGDTLRVKFPERDTSNTFGTINVIEDTLYITDFTDNDFIIRGYRYRQ